MRLLTLLLLTASHASFLLAETSTPVAIDPASDWPWWRGPTRDNHAAPSARPVLRFSETENVVWSVPVPGRGHASPAVVGTRVFLATAIDEDQLQAVVAFDRETGRQLRIREVSRGALPKKIHPKNTHASGTVASDGERVFASFYSSGSVHVAALSLEGEPVWERKLGPFEPKKYEFGYAASPLIAGEAVVVVGDQEKEGFLVALDRATGEILWKTDRPNEINYASPTLATLKGVEQILLGGCSRVAAYCPADGKLLWEALDSTPPQTCGTVAWVGDLVFASGGYPSKMTTAVRAGTGEVVWRNQRKCYEQSLLAHEGHVYAVTDNGIAYCWRAEDGKEMWSERLKGPVSASPVLAGDRIYAVNEQGTWFVFRATPERFESLAENSLGDEVFATPAVGGDRLFARVAFVDDEGERRERLYCLGAGE